MPDAVAVHGLKEVRKALRQIDDPDALPEFRAGLKRAAEIVATDAKRRVPVRTGRARESIRATAGGNRAYINEGRARVPWAGWLDFGSRHPTSGNPRSVGPWAGSGKGPARGRFIYPAIDAKQREVTDAIGDAMDKAIKKAGLH